MDRVRRRTLLLVVNPLTALAVLPLLFVHDAGDVWIIYVVALAYGASYVLLSAGQSALLATLRPGRPARPRPTPRCRPSAKALRLVAPLAGAGLYTLAGGGAVAILDAATFLAATAALLALKVREPKPDRTPSPWRADRRRRAPHPRARPTSSGSSSRCALCMLVIGFGETLLFELPRRARQARLVRRRPDGRSAASARSRARSPRRGSSAGTARLALAGFGHDDLRHRRAADGRQRAARSCSPASPLRPRPAVDGHRRCSRCCSASTPGPSRAARSPRPSSRIGAPQTLAIALGAALVALVDYRLYCWSKPSTVGLAGVSCSLTRMHGPWRPWTAISTTSWSMPTGSRARTRARSWRRWRRSAPRR